MPASERLLVVDDEETIRIVVADALQNQGYSVQTAASAAEALRVCETAVFDLALIDLKMPGTMDGLGLLGELRRRWPKIVLIVMTGYGTLDSAIAALRQGAHDYLAKPASLAQIIASVQSGLAKKQEETRRQQLIADLEDTLHLLKRDVEAPPAEPALPRESLAIDRRTREVRRGDAPLVLTATEFDLLYYLVQNASRVVMASEIAKEVLGYDLDEVDARPIVRVHIQRLRQKLDDDPLRPRYIMNVRARGYRFVG
jgi:DNA-binding response OmpR family regulator